MKIKVRTYYKQWYSNGSYVILYTGTKCAYLIAYKRGNQPLVKYDKKIKEATIKFWEEFINTYSYNVKEISKGDVFLEML